MKVKKNLKCRAGVPVGIILLLIGLSGIIANIIDFQWMSFLPFLAIFLIAMPFARMTMMMSLAHRRLDALEDRK